MNASELQNEKTQIDEGPCDIALPSEIKKMPADIFTKYALWKKECEEEEARKAASNEDVNEWGNSHLDQEIAKQKAEDDEKDNDKDDVWAKNFKRGAKRRLRQKQYRDDQQADEFGEGMISGDWEKLGITNDDLEPDDAFGGGAWSVGLGGPNSKFYWFKEQNTGTHFATVVDIGNGTWKIEDADGNAVKDTALKSWDNVERIVGRMFLGPRTAHDETPVDVDEDGRPRGGAHIENERFWDLPDDQLHYIIKDASAAVQENPTAGKATQGPGNWSDQINDAATVLTYRKNKRLKADDVAEGFDTEKHEGVVADVWFAGDDGEETGGELTYTAYLDHDTGQYRVDPDSLDGNIDVTNNPGRIPEDSVRDFIDGDLEEYVAMAQEDADEHAGERDNKYAHGESVEDDNVSGALDTMRNHLNDYNHDPSTRWEKYNQYRNQRKQISKRAKSLK